MNYGDFVQKMLDSYLQSLSKKAIFIKQNSLSGELIDDILVNVGKRNDIKILYHEYSIYEMKDAYEPFIDWIRQCYYKYYEKKCSIEEFLKDAKVYSLQRDVLASYIRNGVCTREFEVMIEEYEYEQECMLYSIYNIIKYISRHEPLVLLIRKLHMAPECVLKLINHIFDNNNNIHFIFTCGESFLVKDYCKNEWDILFKKADDENMILEWTSEKSYDGTDYPDEFIYREEEVEQYITKLINMYHTFSFMDAKYYMHNIHSYMFRDTSTETDDTKLRFLEVIANIYLATGYYRETLFTCENMMSIISDKGYKYWEYTYNYLSAKAHLLMTESQLVYKFCDKCRALIDEEDDEKYLMNVEIIETIAHFGSLKEIFKCDYKYKIDEKVIERVKKYNNKNALAYLYIFDSEQDEEMIKKIGNGEAFAERFDAGVAIAEKLDNKNLLLLAYMKNIIIYSEYGFHRYVNKMYEKRISIVDSNKPLRMAHMYGGLGYNSIVLEDYVKADEYLRKSLKILLENNTSEDIAETLYNMLMNYFAANINDKVVECANLLFKVMDLINIQAIRICNTSKIYALQALAYYKMGEYYDCYYCFNKIETYMSYVLSKDNDEVRKLWLEDLFLYHLCKGNISTIENNLEEAKVEYELAYKYMESVKGTKYYSYAEYASCMADFYDKAGDNKAREEVLTAAYDYCIQNNHMIKATMLNAKLRRIEFQVNRSFADKKLPVSSIIDNCTYVGVVDKLNSREKDIDFLSVCHDVMIREENYVDELINNSMEIIQNSYNFDRMWLLERNNNKTTVSFLYEDTKISQQDIDGIFAFFDEYRTEFISSRIEKSFNVYNDITSKIGKEDIVTIVGIPVFVEGVITRIFLATVDVHRHFTGNRKLLTKNNLVSIKYAIGQLDEAIRRIKNACIIKVMNAELERAAFTDQLTGIYNRMGFDRILKDNISEEGIVLYMDLDNFKKYNDTYGHDVGDLIIKEFATILNDNVKNIGYAIRYGGDEFVAVIPDKDTVFGKTIAEKIGSQLIDNNNIRVAIDGNTISSSIGIAKYYSATRQALEMALKNADTALYEVKKKRKGQVAVYN